MNSITLNNLVGLADTTNNYLNEDSFSNAQY